MPQDLTDDKSTLVQVMAWCRQAASHYLNQCWPRSPMPYGVTRPQWVNWLSPGVCGFHDFKMPVGEQQGTLLMMEKSFLKWSPVQHGSCNCLLLDGTKPLPEPMLPSYLWGFLSFTWLQFHHQVPKLLFCTIKFKNHTLKLFISQRPMSWKGVIRYGID